MSPLRLNGSTSGYSQLDAPAIAGDQTFTLPGTGGTIDRLNRAGNILQVVQGTYSTGTNVSSTSYVDSGLTASITPTSASSKILVLVSLSGDYVKASNVYTQVFHNIVRGSTQIMEKSVSFAAGTSGDGYVYFPIQGTMFFLDSPNTTSSTTYKDQGKLSTTASAGAIRYHISSTVSVMTLLEVAA